MNNDEFLARVPWQLGVASGALCGSARSDVKFEGSRLFWCGPRYHALCDLARRHPDEYALLVTAQERVACERYGAESWAEQEPKKEGDDGNSTATSD